MEAADSSRSLSGQFETFDTVTQIVDNRGLPPPLGPRMNLINLTELSSADVRSIWGLVDTPSSPLSGTVAWSFEGNGIRTRSTVHVQGCSLICRTCVRKTPWQPNPAKHSDACALKVNLQVP